MKQLFPERWHEILSNNKIVDKLISLNSDKNVNDWNILDEGYNKYILIDNKGNSCMGKTTRVIKSKELQIIRHNWLIKCSKSNAIQL